MTEKQKITVEKLTAELEHNDFYGKDDYEFKAYEVTESELGIVCLYCVSGLKDDEGTMASVLCRKTRQIFIGKQGGLTSYDNQKKNGKAALHSWQDIMLYGYRN